MAGSPGPGSGAVDDGDHSLDVARLSEAVERQEAEQSQARIAIGQLTFLVEEHEALITELKAQVCESFESMQRVFSGSRLLEKDGSGPPLLTGTGPEEVAELKARADRCEAELGDVRAHLTADMRHNQEHEALIAELRAQVRESSELMQQVLARSQLLEKDGLGPPLLPGPGPEEVAELTARADRLEDELKEVRGLLTADMHENEERAKLATQSMDVFVQFAANQRVTMGDMQVELTKGAEQRQELAASLSTSCGLLNQLRAEVDGFGSLHTEMDALRSRTESWYGGQCQPAHRMGCDEPVGDAAGPAHAPRGDGGGGCALRGVRRTRYLSVKADLQEVSIGRSARAPVMRHLAMQQAPNNGSAALPASPAQHHEVIRVRTACASAPSPTRSFSPQHGRAQHSLAHLPMVLPGELECGEVTKSRVLSMEERLSEVKRSATGIRRTLPAHR